MRYLIVLAAAILFPVNEVRSGTDRAPPPTCKLQSGSESRALFDDIKAVALRALTTRLFALRKQLGTDEQPSVLLNTCLSKLDEIQSMCEKVDGMSTYCRLVDSDPNPNAEDTKAAKAADVKTLLMAANCARTIANCYKQQGIFTGKLSRSDVDRACKELISERFRQIGHASTPEGEQLKIAINLHNDVSRAVFDHQATCGSEWGKHHEARARQALTEHQERLSIAHDLRIACIDREDRARTCDLFQSNAEIIEKMTDEDDRLTKTTRGEAPVFLKRKMPPGRCSGECISIDGHCNYVLTARHCGSMTSAIVVGEKQTVVAVEVGRCVASNTSDWQLCKISPSLKTDTVTLRLLDERRSDNHCNLFGIIRACGSNAFLEISKSNSLPGSIIGFGGGMLRKRGTITYDATKEMFSSNILTQQGDSGAALKVANVEGGFDVVGVSAKSSTVALEADFAVLKLIEFSRVFVELTGKQLPGLSESSLVIRRAAEEKPAASAPIGRRCGPFEVFNPRAPCVK